MGIKERYARTLDEVRAQCAAAGRDPEAVTLVAVSKTVGEEGVGEAFAAGARDFGENRPDQIVSKAAAYPEATWHFIGNIQSRRIPEIVASSTLIHSLFQLSHAEKIDAAAERLGKVQDVLVEVNVSGEASKSGVAPEDAEALVRACAALGHVRVRGLMTMAPQGDRAVARACFDDLARLHARIRAALDPHDAEAFDELSMGMSEDWHEAICAGATIVRVGRAIFSDSFE
ncbi:MULTISPECIES: YggS family pyridoxal phosphate-dependent enzyme [unclassified Adlercreutzia]|uniref:YggS family pyridoxal phosphate-dependent enzyme n=1 Tax=unclassified Adlercreutzia TaxID=2636013 RepID=UPI0013ED229F|nr:MULTISPECIES: YggS family pyridoxal phosphate-dependent enzyme [unclassified Adlercreutzia]